MKTINTLCILIMFGSLAHAAPAPDVQEKECAQVYRKLAWRYVRSNQELVDLFSRQLEKPLNIANMQLCKKEDLDQGSMAVRRKVALCDRHNRLVLFTVGDEYCQNERVLGIKDLRPRNQIIRLIKVTKPSS